MNIELRLPEKSDQDPNAEYRWLWSASEGVELIGELREFPEPGIRQFRFSFDGPGNVSFSLKSVVPPAHRKNPYRIARIAIEVDETGLVPSLSDQS